MAEERSTRKVEPASDRLLEALIDLARSAIANRRDATDRRAKLRVVDGGRRAA